MASDSICDRLAPKGHRIALEGKSLSKTRSVLTKEQKSTNEYSFCITVLRVSAILAGVFEVSGIRTFGVLTN